MSMNESNVVRKYSGMLLSAVLAATVGSTVVIAGQEGKGAYSSTGSTGELSRDLKTQDNEVTPRDTMSQQEGAIDANRDMVYLDKEKEEVFSRLDEDKDSWISREEARSEERVSENFDKLDTKGDGKLSRSEFSMFELSGTGEEKSD